MPRTVECELKDDLVESCIPGDVVVCSGIVKVPFCILNECICFMDIKKLLMIRDYSPLGFEH